MALDRLIRVLRWHQEDPERIRVIYRASFACGSPEQELLDQAIEVCELAHAGQTRKLTGEPYANHPKIVSGGILAEYLGSDDVEELATALVHDVPEDNGKWPYSRMKGTLGKAVASGADWCNRNRFAHITEKEERERCFLKNLLHVAPSMPIRVKIAEKLHNCMTPWRLDDPIWVEEEIRTIRDYYLPMSRKCGGVLLNELVMVIEALERGECLLPPLTATQTS